MEQSDLIQKLKDYGIHTKAHFYAEAFSRNIGLLTPAEQTKLSEATVAIPGMGGVGGVHLMTMVRLGIGKFHLADFDTFDVPNVNRQYGAKVPTFGKNKLAVMTEEALSVNPHAEIKAFPHGINETNLDEFLDGVDVVIDSLDYFEFDIRRMLFNRAREKGVYVITAGPMGFSSALLIFSPHEGMGFDEYFNIVSGMTPQDHYLAYAIGLAPRATHFKYMDTSRIDFNSKAGPSSIIGCQLCAGMAATEAMRIILKRGKIKPAPYFSQFDPFSQKYKKGKLSMGNRNPIQQLKFWAAKKFILSKRQTGKRESPIPPEWLDKTGLIPEAVVRYLVEMGTWAPSADNCQPWKFKWEGSRLLLLKDPERTGFFYDVNQESTFLTFGAVIENIRIAASYFGIEVRVDYLPKGADDALVAFMEFSRTGLAEDPLYPFLLTRCVNRNPYNGKAIPENIIKALQNEAITAEGITITLVNDPDQQKIFQELIYLGDRVLFEDKRLHAGLFKWLRRSIEPDGMGWDTLGLTFSQRLAFPLMEKWAFLNVMNKVGLSRILGANSIKLLKPSPLYSVISIDNRTPLNYIKGGEIMERLWINANSLGLSLQPMAGFIFLLNHYDQDKGARFSKHHQKMLKTIFSLYESAREGGTTPLFFFRMGLAKPQTSTNRRRPPAEVLTVEAHQP